MIFNVFCNSVDFVLWFVDLDLRVGCRNGVNLPINFLLFENGSLSDIDCKFGLTVACVRRDDFLSELIFFDHEFEVNVDIFA